MAKNLKVKIKNAQLAEAFQIGKKKAPVKKKAAPKKEEEKPAPVKEEPVASEPKVEKPKEAAPATPPPKKYEIKSTPRRSTPLRKLPVNRKDAAGTTAPKKPEPKKAEEPKKSGLGQPKTRRPSTFKDFREVKKKPTGGGRFDARDRMGLRGSDDGSWRRRRPSHRGAKAQTEDLTIRPKSLHIRLPISIKDLAQEMKLKASQLIATLFKQGMAVTINDVLDDETTVQLLGHEFSCEITIDTSEEERIKITDKTIKEEVASQDPEKLSLRPPVVAFMGHVDHGKTSLIDAIRKSDIAAGEAGAITQHIGAFKTHSDVGEITILDTPGHEAFSAMRARGADVTDLIVLVIAGDEGIRDQTVEAMNQAKEAGVPILVAINKSDKPGFNAENIYRELSEHELLPEAWGGTTITVNCSAQTGEGIKELLDMLALQSEILELKADASARARGSVIESAMHKGLGAVATVLVQNGTLHLGDSLVFDLNWARVKTMHDEHGKQLEKAPPSTPVKITGLSGLPEAGSEFIKVESEKEARDISEVREQEHRSMQLLKKKRGIEALLEKKAEEQEKKILHVMLRADVQGSLEALKQSLQKIHSKKAMLNIVSEEVGQISESDVELAAASGAVIIGFHTQVESHAEDLIKQKKVTIRLHDIIYHAVDDVKAIMRDLLDKIAEENELGKALVKATFKASALGVIAGCQVSEGIIKRNSLVRLVREEEVIWKGTIASLKRVQEDVREVSKGLECGILLQGNNDVKENDIIEAYEITYHEQDL